MRKLILSVFLFPILLFAQVEHGHTYQILQFSESARMAILNDPIGFLDADINMGMYNPSLLNSNMNGSVSLNFVDYFADINIVSGSYAFLFKDVGIIGVSIKSLNFGEFIETDVNATELGVFNSGEQLMTIGLGKKIHNNFTAGVNLKMLFSSLESYSSFGLASDLSVTYLSKNNQFGLALLAKNIGRQITSYTAVSERIPFELKMGLGKQLAHLPLIFFLNYNNIEQWRLNYSDDNQIGFFKTAFNHISTSAELSLGKYLKLRMGYDARRRYEMAINEFLGMVGFSWGLGIKVSHFEINYGRSSYHLAGSPNYFSITTNISKFNKIGK